MRRERLSHFPPGPEPAARRAPAGAGQRHIPGPRGPPLPHARLPRAPPQAAGPLVFSPPISKSGLAGLCSSQTATTRSLADTPHTLSGGPAIRPGIRALARGRVPRDLCFAISRSF